MQIHRQFFTAPGWCEATGGGTHLQGFDMLGHRVSAAVDGQFSYSQLAVQARILTKEVVQLSEVKI